MLNVWNYGYFRPVFSSSGDIYAAVDQDTAQAEANAANSLRVTSGSSGQTWYTAYGRVGPAYRDSDLVTVSSRTSNVTLMRHVLLFSSVGFLDDFKKAFWQNPSGITGRSKLVLQFIFTGTILYVLFHSFGLTSDIGLFQGHYLQLPLYLYVGIILLFVVGSANAINFTDGLDGLLINVAIPTYFFFFMISDKPEVQTFSLVMIGCLLGLFLYNIYPARAFMGDTGSLAIGGSLSILAVIEKVELLIPILFFVYFAEQLSVILQVWYYKRTKLRLFRMAPIHYHFSLKYGWSENKIVMIFGFISWVSVLICCLIWKYLMH